MPDYTDLDFLLPIGDMKALDFVFWDRYAGRPDDFVVFGWIARADGRSDFVILSVLPQGVSFSTSSAEWSGEIDKRLNGGVPSATHNPCRKVVSHPAAAGLPNVVGFGVDQVVKIFGYPAVETESIPEAPLKLGRYGVDQVAAARLDEPPLTDNRRSRLERLLDSSGHSVGGSAALLDLIAKGAEAADGEGRPVTVKIGSRRFRLSLEEIAPE